MVRVIVGNHDRVDVGKLDSELPHIGDQWRRIGRFKVATDVEQDRASIGSDQVGHACFAAQPGVRHVPVHERQDFEGTRVEPTSASLAGTCASAGCQAKPRLTKAVTRPALQTTRRAIGVVRASTAIN